MKAELSKSPILVLAVIVVFLPAQSFYIATAQANGFKTSNMEYAVINKADPWVIPLLLQIKIFLTKKFKQVCYPFAQSSRSGISA